VIDSHGLALVENQYDVLLVFTPLPSRGSALCALRSPHHSSRSWNPSTCSCIALQLVEWGGVGSGSGGGVGVGVVVGVRGASDLRHKCQRNYFIYVLNVVFMGVGLFWLSLFWWNRRPTFSV
jgi:hypothetical protein